MTDFNKMKDLFEKIGLDVVAYESLNHKFIDVIDNEGTVAKFTFNTDGSFSESNYYKKEPATPICFLPTTDSSTSCVGEKNDGKLVQICTKCGLYKGTL